MLQIIVVYKTQAHPALLKNYKEISMQYLYTYMYWFVVSVSKRPLIFARVYFLSTTEGVVF